jgi:hypothetical protein
MSEAEQGRQHLFRTKGQICIEETRAHLAQTNTRLSELHSQREERLLANDLPAAIEFGTQAASLQLTARALEERVELLVKQGEAAEKRAKETEAENARTDLLFDLRSEEAAKLSACLKQATKHYRAMHDCNRKIAARHSWTAGDQSATLIVQYATDSKVRHEMQRLSYVPFAYGGQTEDVNAGQPLPGAKSPSVQMVGQPASIPLMVDVFREAGEYGKRVLRGKPGVVVNGAAVAEVLVPATNGQDGADVGAVAEGVQHRAAAMPSGSKQRSEPEQRLAALLKRQNELAEDTSPQADEEYQRVVREIARVQSELEQQQYGR